MLSSRTYVAIPPGATIKEQLADRGMSQKEFAIRMNLSEKHVSQLINGKVELTPEVANHLEMVFGIPASFWNSLETNYRDKIIKVNEENTMEADKEILKQMPYQQMVECGWVSKTQFIVEQVFNLRKFYEVSELSILDNNDLMHLACRRLKITDKSDAELLAFAQEAKIKAREIKTSKINIERLTKMIPDIKEMTQKDLSEFSSDLIDLLAGCGIALVILPSLKGSYLHGVTFKDGNKIVIGITNRGKYADRFWFSLFHEFAHVILGHLDKTEDITEQEEADADDWAANTLIDNHEYSSFVDLHKRFNRSAILEFSKRMDIAPGIVVGRLQKEGKLGHSEFNDLKTKYELV